jgi:hypothetical protein
MSAALTLRSGIHINKDLGHRSAGSHKTRAVISRHLFRIPIFTTANLKINESEDVKTHRNERAFVSSRQLSS